MFFLIILGCSAHKGKTDDIAHIRFERINIVGEEPLNGFFDLSVEYGNDGIGWMAYSRVKIPEYVETHLAKSSDRGKTWRYLKVVNRSTAGLALIDGKWRKGVWRYETPTLLFDPTDISERRWKLFVHRYFTVPPYKRDNRCFERGWVEYKYAATPDGRWSKGVRLFGSRENNCRVDLGSTHPELKNFHHYSEIGSMVKDGTIYISLDASVTSSGLGKWKERKVVLVSSPDHGVTWNYAGTLTDHKDADTLGYAVLTGSSLVRERGREFALLTPSGRKGLFRKNRAHDGIIAVEFKDIRRAQLKRDPMGRLVILKRFKPDLTSGGLSDYDEQNTAGGIVFSQINLPAMPAVFQIFSTKERICR
jgi:hypothetical protein